MMDFTTTFVVAPVNAWPLPDAWVVARDGRVLHRLATREAAWRAALAPAHEASMRCDDPVLVIERDSRGRVVRHMELGSRSARRNMA